MYHLIAIIVFVLGVTRGYRKGFIRQLPLFIGFWFGIICARLFCDPVMEAIRDFMPSLTSKVECEYVCSQVARGLIFLLVYEIFSVVTGFLRLVLKAFDSGIFDSICGMVFGAVRYLLILSIILNWLLCVRPRGTLLQHAKSDDGNIIEEVMLIAPAILGGESVEDLAHQLQLEDAKKIS